MLLKGKTRLFALLLIALCLTACAAQTAPEPAPAAQSEETLVPAPEQPEAPQPESLAEVQPQVAYTPHAAYMFGQNGYFFPDRELTRAEAARVLVYVFDTPADAHVEFTDVAADSWFYP